MEKMLAHEYLLIRWLSLMLTLSFSFALFLLRSPLCILILSFVSFTIPKLNRKVMSIFHIHTYKFTSKFTNTYNMHTYIDIDIFDKQKGNITRRVANREQTTKTSIEEVAHIKKRIRWNKQRKQNTNKTHQQKKWRKRMDTVRIHSNTYTCGSSHNERLRRQ